MARRLYLDTARLGLMRTGAQRLYQDFVRLAGEEGCTLYWEEFLRSGWNAWPESLKGRYPALNAWHGIAGLKNSLRRIVGASPDSQVLLANRSAMLMKLAARLLFRRCRNALITDLTWPAYLKTLKTERQRTGNHLTCVRLRQRLLTNRMESGDVVDMLAQRFRDSGCDGLFLPAVDHLGIQLPIGNLVRAIREREELRCAVVDGAQALAHVPLPLTDYDCDFLIGGCHKWLGAYHPLGIGFTGPRLPADELRQIFKPLLHRRLDDPLLRFSEELESGHSTRFGETVNVVPLLTAQGAVNEYDSTCPTNTLRTRIANADRLLSRVDAAAWTPHLPTTSLRTGILLLRAHEVRLQQQPEATRLWLHDHGIAVTSYPRGLLRLSMPHVPWPAEELEHLACTLNRRPPV